MNTVLFNDRLHVTVAQLASTVRLKFDVTKMAGGLEQDFADLMHLNSKGDLAFGSLRFFSAPKVEWVARAELKAPTEAFASTRLFVWCSAETIVPHLAIEVSSFGSTIKTYFDYVPRIDLVTDAEYVNKYYEAARKIRSRLEAKGFEIYRTSSAYEEAMSSPAALPFHFQADNEEIVSSVEAVLRQYVQQWFDWMDEAESTPLELREALQKRDRLLRHSAAYMNSDNRRFGFLYGKAVARRMLEGLAGPQG